MEILQGTLADEIAREAAEQEAKTQPPGVTTAAKKNGALDVLRTVVDTTLFLPDKLRKIITLTKKAENQLKDLKPIERMTTNIVEHNKKHLLRIYPFGLRFDSSNLDPFVYWATGCQMVCLNYQTNGRSMNLNRGFFKVNGGSGWVLKPPALRSGAGRQFSPAEEVPRALRCSPPEIKVLMIRVLWAHHDHDGQAVTDTSSSKALLKGIRSADMTDTSVDATPAPDGLAIDEIDAEVKGEGVAQEGKEEEDLEEEQDQAEEAVVVESPGRSSEGSEQEVEQEVPSPVPDDVQQVRIDIGRPGEKQAQPGGAPRSRPMIAVRLHAMLWKECETSTHPQEAATPYWNEQFW
jgi:hypothetical protein